MEKINGMEEYVLQPDDDEIGVIEGELEAQIEILRKLKPNQYFVVGSIQHDGNNQQFQRQLDRLRENGLDIGRHDAEYGFRMPLPESDDDSRYLIIFRRK